MNQYIEKIANTLIEEQFYQGIPHSRLELDDRDMATIFERGAREEGTQAKNREIGQTLRRHIVQGAKYVGGAGAGIGAVVGSRHAGAGLKSRVAGAALGALLGGGVGATAGGIGGSVSGAISSKMSGKANEAYKRGYSQEANQDMDVGVANRIHKAVDAINREEGYTSDADDNSYVSIPMGALGSYLNVRTDVLNKMRSNDIDKATSGYDKEEDDAQEFFDEISEIGSRPPSYYSREYSDRLRRKIGL